MLLWSSSENYGWSRSNIADYKRRWYERLTGCWMLCSVDAWQLEWMYLPQYQVPPAGQCHETCPCRTQRRSFWFTACHWRSRIVWCVIVVLYFFGQIIDFYNQNMTTSHNLKCYIQIRGLFSHLRQRSFNDIFSRINWVSWHERNKLFWM